MRIIQHQRHDPDFLRLTFYAALEGHHLAQNFSDKHVRPLYEFLCDYVVQRQREGAFRSHNPGTVVRALIGLPSYHAIVRGLTSDNLLNVTDEEAATTFTHLILAGLRCEPSAEPSGKKPKTVKPSSRKRTK